MKLHHKKQIFGILLFLFILFPVSSFAGENNGDSTLIPITTVFYRMDRNMFGSFSYNYGLNYIIGAVASYGLVAGGTDWSWHRNAVDHRPVGYHRLAAVRRIRQLIRRAQRHDRHRTHRRGRFLSRGIIDRLRRHVGRPFANRLWNSQKLPSPDQPSVGARRGTGGEGFSGYTNC